MRNKMGKKGLCIYLFAPEEQKLTFFKRSFIGLNSEFFSSSLTCYNNKVKKPSLPYY